MTKTLEIGDRVKLKTRMSGDLPAGTVGILRSHDGTSQWPWHVEVDGVYGLFYERELEPTDEPLTRRGPVEPAPLDAPIEPVDTTGPCHECGQPADGWICDACELAELRTTQTELELTLMQV